MEAYSIYFRERYMASSTDIYFTTILVKKIAANSQAE